MVGTASLAGRATLDLPERADARRSAPGRRTARALAYVPALGPYSKAVIPSEAKGAWGAFTIIRISDYPIEAPTDQILAAQVLAADAQVRGESLDGYEVREIGGRSGLLSLRTSREGQLREVFWTTVVGTSGRYRSVDLNAGAFDGNFVRLEADLAAILTSLRSPAEAADPQR